MWEIWANLLLPKALKSCTKSNKSTNLVILSMANIREAFSKLVLGQQNSEKRSYDRQQMSSLCFPRANIKKHFDMNKNIQFQVESKLAFSTFNNIEARAPISSTQACKILFWNKSMFFCVGVCVCTAWQFSYGEWIH